MPIYEYTCAQCCVSTDVTASVGARDLIVIACPLCEQRMIRQPAAPAFQLKGSGWTKVAKLGA